MTLTDFLLARIDEDEAIARDFTGYAPVNGLAVLAENSGDYLVVAAARVLAECEAKRQIVKLHHECGTGHGYCDDSGHGWGPQRNLPLGCANLAYLASVHADHPDFYEALRP